MKSALRVALIYGVFGVVWIAVSDRFVEALVADPRRITSLQTLKGWAFVVASALLLFFLVGREMRIRKRAEEARTDSENKFRAIFAAATDGMLLADTKSRMFVTGNEAIARMLGYSSGELAGMGVKDIHPAEDLPFVVEQFEKQARGELSIAVDIPVRRKDGSVFFADINAAPVTLGGRVCLLGMFRDVTGRKASEDALKRSRELLVTHHKTLVDIAKDEDLYKDAIKAAFERIAADASRALAVRRVSIWLYLEDRSGIRCMELFDEGQGAHSEGMLLAAAEYPAYFRAMADGDLIAAHDAHTDPRTREFSGSYLAPLGISSMLDVPIRVSGKTVGVVCHEHTGPPRTWTVEEQSFATAIAGFVTSVIEANERARNERLIQNIFESMGEGLVVVDREYRILAANRAYCRMAGRDRDDVVGKHCYEVTHRIRRPCSEMGIDCPLERTFATGEPHSAVHCHPAEEGRNAYTEIASHPIRDASGAVTSVIEIHNDITEKRKLEDQLRQAQKMEAIGQLAGGVAHDFNNILTAIVGYAHLASVKLREDDPSRHDLAQILASTQRAAALTQSLLAFSRRQPVTMRSVELNAMIANFEKFLRRLIGADIEMRTVCSRGELTVMADSGQIEQVLMNLVTNARDAMPRGGRLTIETGAAVLDEAFADAHGYGAPGDYARIAVSDTGIGMNEQTRAKMFEPFFTTKEQGKGTGLGLSMVYGIVKKHDGFIDASSEPGKGTTFRIYLPVHRSAAATGGDSETTGMREGPDG